MFLSDISIKRPIMMSMFLIVFVLFGAMAYFGMNLELTPQIDLPMVTVQTIYGGAGPQELESQVSKKIEDAVSPISDIDYIQSYSMENVSFVMIAFELSKDVNIGLSEVKDKVDGIVNDLPEDADLPIIQKMDINALPVVNLVFSGPQPITELYDYTDRYLQNRLSQIKGVANVEVTGGQEREIRVEMDNKTVLQHSVSLPQLAQILAAQNMDMPGGNFKRESQEYAVRLEGEFDDVESMRKLEIPTAHGTKALGELATVRDTGAEVTERTTYFNNITKSGDDNVIQLGLVRASDGNAVEIYRSLIKNLPEINKSLPPGSSLELVFDSATLVEDSVQDTLVNIFLGILLTSLILLFFLHDYKSTIIVAISMPMSLVSAFLFMKHAGFTLNILSLMGLSTSVGILVTNSVVVLENIFRHKNMGHNNVASASKGTAEIAMAVIASAGTNLVVFLPLATMSSIAGKFLQQFSLTVVFATIFSLIMSFTLTPMLASLILPEHDRKKHPIGQRLERIFTAWEKAYKKLLRALMFNKKRGGLVILVSALLFVGSLFIAGTLGFEFAPNMDEGTIAIQVELPVGYKLDETAATLKTIEDRIKTHEEVSHYWTTLGKISDVDLGSNLALMTIRLVDKHERNCSTEELNTQFIRELSDIPNAKIRPAVSSTMMSGRSDIQFYLLGQDVDSLEVYKQKMLPRMAEISGLINLKTSSTPGKPEVTLLPDRHKLAQAGLTIADLAYALRSSVDGMVTTSYKNQGEEYDIRVTMTDETVDSPEKIGSISVIGAGGSFRLDQLVNVVFTDGYSKIMHKDRFKTIEFNCDVGPGYVMGDIMNELTEIVDGAHLPSGYESNWGGMAEEMGAMIADILRAFIIAIVLTYMLLAAILESLTQPLLILGTVPLALIGVFVALALTGLSLNIVSLLAIVMLVGIVVNNAILQLDYTNQLVRNQGRSVHDALLEACPTKLKPILMSSAAIILGMMPMALGIGASGAEMRQPMGVVSIGGIIASTILSLVVIPVLYNVVSRKKETK